MEIAGKFLRNHGLIVKSNTTKYKFVSKPKVYLWWLNALKINSDYHINYFSA